MPRTVKEWIGKDDDTPIPPRVKTRVVARANHCCANCGIRVRYGGQIDHIVALINGGENRESNLRLLCANCHKAKSRRDVAEKSKIAQTQIRMGPLKRERRGFWAWRKFDGTIVYRNERE